MAAYNITISGATLSTSNDTATFVTAATGVGSMISLYEVDFGGESASSTVNRIAFDRSTGGTTGGGAYTMVALNPASAAASGLAVYSTWSAQPTLSGSRVLTPCFNGFGGRYRWEAAPDRPIIVGTQGAAANLSVRSLSGTGVVSGDLKFELA